MHSDVMPGGPSEALLAAEHPREVAELAVVASLGDLESECVFALLEVAFCFQEVKRAPA